MAFIVDLLQSIKRGDSALASRLISECNDVNEDKKDHKTALGHVVRSGNKEIVKLLLDKGADMVVDSYRNATAIHYAAALGDMDMIELLVQRGGDINAKTSGGQSLMHWAARENRSIEEHEFMLHKFIELGADFSGSVAEAYANSSGRLGLCKVLAILGDKIDWSQSTLTVRFGNDYDFNMLFESDNHILGVAAILNTLQGLIKSPEFEDKDKYVDQVSNKLADVIDLVNPVRFFGINGTCETLDFMAGLVYFLEAYKKVPEELKQSETYSKIESFKNHLDELIDPFKSHLKEIQTHKYKLYFKSMEPDTFHLNQLKSYSNVKYEVEKLQYVKKIWTYIGNKFQDQSAQLGNTVGRYIDFCLVELPKLIDASQESHEAKLKALYDLTLNDVARGYIKEFIDPNVVTLKVLYWFQQKLPKELKRDLSYILNPLGEPENEEYVFNTLKLLPPSSQTEGGVEESKQVVGELPDEA